MIKKQLEKTKVIPTLGITVAWQRLVTSIIGSLAPMSKRHNYRNGLREILQKKFQVLVEIPVGERRNEVVRKLFNR